MFNLYKNVYPADWYVVNDTFTSEEYNSIFNGLKSIPFLEGIQQGNDMDQHKDLHRISNIKWIPKIYPWNWLYKKLSGIIQIANQECWNFDLHSIIESIQYTEYSAQEKGHYGWHLDIGNGPTSLRKISITVQLSDPEEYKGGDLEFNIGKEESPAPKSKGTSIIFPSYLLHRVTPVTEGVRKSLVLWVGGNQFR